MVATFKESGVTDLRELAELDELPMTRLRNGEADTIIGVASGLLRWSSAHLLPGADDEAMVAGWARWTEPLDLTPGLDPYVGTVKGGGPTSFAYLRMRSGGDGIKIDD